jgi:G3E family GTPase
VRVPLVVVTGFLGAGKTTLVNRLLARRALRPAGRTARIDDTGASRDPRGKLGVIVNELGEVGIDGALLGGASRQIELPGGCVCCVLGDELDKTLIELVQNNPGLEAIVLETSGVAEPLPIAWAVQREPVRNYVRLAAVVTLVDATNFLASRPTSVAVDAQVAYADVLLVTKAEVAGSEETAQAIASAHDRAPNAQIITGTTDDHVAWLEQVLADPDLEHAGREHVHDEHCDHAHDVDTTWVSADAPLDVEELEDQLADLPGNYVRIKGIVRSGDNGWYAVHRVGLRVSSEPLGRNPEGNFGEHGRIVALGRDLTPEKLADCLRAAYAKT